MRATTHTPVEELETDDEHETPWWADRAVLIPIASGVAFVAGLAPPARTDEVEYHWPAALQWAQTGSWVDSHFRHVDGFPLMEVIYTVPATWGAYGAAHWLHLMSLVGLGLVVAGIATSMGIRGSAAVGTAAMATAANQSVHKPATRNIQRKRIVRACMPHLLCLRVIWQT